MLNEIVYLNPSRQHSNIGVNGYGTEADNMMVVAKKVKAILVAPGVFKEVVLTEGLTLSQAIAESNAKGATIHLDIHSDANIGLTRGCTGIYKSDKGKQLISCIYKHVSALTPSADRGLSYRTDLGCLNQTNAVAGLIECFFHDNADDVRFYEANINAFAQAIADGILEYCGVVKEVVVASAPVKTGIVYPTGSKYNPYILDVQRLINKSGLAKLTEDGKCGPLTMVALSLVNIKRGSSRKDFVVWIQKMLNLTADGIFGEKTYNAVVAYQIKVGLKPDGVVGRNTILKMCGYN